jgi:hypothetical protein
MRRRHLGSHLVLPALLGLAVGCAKDPAGPEIVLAEGRLLIEDLSGKRWDVTHARNRYGLDPDLFRHGLGPGAIPPILRADMLLPGEPGYPEAGSKRLVIGVRVEASVRSYPLEIMGWHEIANDRFGNLPIAIGYCPLAQLTAAYERRVGEQTLTLAASGWTYQQTFVLYDLETESLWYPLPGTTGLTCIAGAWADSLLREHPSTLERWRDWQAANPGAEVLAPPYAGAPSETSRPPR